MRDIRGFDFQHHGIAEGFGYGRSVVGGRRQGFAGDTDAVGGEEGFGLALGKRWAAGQVGAPVWLRRQDGGRGGGVGGGRVQGGGEGGHAWCAAVQDWHPGGGERGADGRMRAAGEQAEQGDGGGGVGGVVGDRVGDAGIFFGAGGIQAGRCVLHGDDLADAGVGGEQIQGGAIPLWFAEDDAGEV